MVGFAPRNSPYMDSMTDLLDPIVSAVSRDGFAFVRAAELGAVLEEAGLRDWDDFAASWDDLGVDKYMADGGRYRRRRFACYRATPEGIARKPHQPHYQSRDYNPLNGGIEPWFGPGAGAIGRPPALRPILWARRGLFDRLAPGSVGPPAWHVEIHQFRI